ncbi:MAG: InlB B-repeat-containing protein [Propionibacteriaceae bacterium]|jgi:uncharacterized repeat protein (TIGR02543 family)|nr:InlB B-repeat-containing protein [Propionibacteriaceae bacterium]
MVRRLALFFTAVALACALPAAPAHADIDVVPDIALKECLNYYYLHQPETAGITQAQLEGLSGSIECQSPTMKSLAGARYLTGVGTLELVGAYSSVTELQTLTSLTSLTIASKNLTKLNGLEKLTSLEVLGIGSEWYWGTKVTSLTPIAKLPYLIHLSLMDNTSLKKLSPLSGNTRLRDLHISNSPISDYNVLSTMTSLRALTVNRGKMKSLKPLAGLTSLEELYLTSNAISDLAPLSGLTNLIALDLTGNQISNISPIAGLSGISELHLTLNRIANISMLPGAMWPLTGNDECAGAFHEACSQTISTFAYVGTRNPPHVVKTVPGSSLSWTVKSGPAVVSGGMITYTKTGTAKLRWEDLNTNFSGLATVTIKSPKVKITFDPNGGTTPKLGNKTYKSKSVTVDKPAGSLPTTTHRTQQFAGWFTEKVGGDQITELGNVPETIGTKVYAQWTAPTSISGLAGVQATYIPKAPVSKAGYVSLLFPNGATQAVNLTDKNVALTGIDTSTTGSGTATITIKPSGLTANFSYTVVPGQIYLDAQLGSVTPSTKDFNYGKKLPSLPTPTRTGYSFKGWYSQPISGGKKYASGKKATQIEPFTEYARWSAKSYTVKFNANGGKVSKTSKTVKYDSTYGALPTPTRKGMAFQGWWTDPAGGTKVEPTDVFTFGATQTLYAHWI